MISQIHIIRPVDKKTSQNKEGEKDEQQKTIEVHQAAETGIAGGCSDHMTGGA